MNPYRILVVDDEEDLCEILQFNLETEGYEVEIANSAEEALKKDISKFNLLLLDVMMGDISGFKMARMLNDNPKTAAIPVIFLTAKDSETDKLTGFNIGADDYISKPFDPDYLIEKVRILLLSQKKLKKQYSKSIRLEPSDIEIESADEVLLKKCISTIEKNLQNEDFSVETLADILNMSNSSLYRKLKSLTNLSSAEFIRSIRIKRAAQLLQDKSKTVSEIAYEVGFNDMKHFRQVFHKQFNCSPSEFREKIQ